MAPDYTMIYKAIQENTAAIQAQAATIQEQTKAIQAQTTAIEANTLALQENTAATKERIKLERGRDNLLAEQNTLIAICAKLILASMGKGQPSVAVHEAILSLQGFGFKSSYLEKLYNDYRQA